MTFLLVAGCVFAFLAVAFGAFGAHALRKRLTADALAVFHTGVQYQMYHALALLVVGVMGRIFGMNGLMIAAGWLFIAGIVVFSGSLYTLVLTGVRRLGAITPLGGLCFLLGWLFLAISVSHLV